MTDGPHPHAPMQTTTAIAKREHIRRPVGDPRGATGLFRAYGIYNKT